MTNALQGASPLGGPPNSMRATKGGPGAFDLTQNIQDAWENAKQQHNQLLQGAKKLDAIRTQLDQLTKLGDTIQVEDVIKGAGTLVGAGQTPAAMAQMLATMPTTGGEALQAWVMQADQKVQAAEQQMAKTLAASGIHKAMAAFASLHLKHVKGQLGPQPPMGGGGGMTQTPGIPAPEPVEQGDEDNA
jgi:hypothetical protein